MSATRKLLGEERPPNLLDRLDRDIKDLKSLSQNLSRGDNAQAVAVYAVSALETVKQCLDSIMRKT